MFREGENTDIQTFLRSFVSISHENTSTRAYECLRIPLLVFDNVSRLPVEQGGLCLGKVSRALRGGLYTSGGGAYSGRGFIFEGWFMSTLRIRSISGLLVCLFRSVYVCYRETFGQELQRILYTVISK